jgi:hypothetical protein
MTTKKFFILSPPRCGSSFLSAVLSSPKSLCHHDLGLFHTLEDWPNYLEENTQGYDHVGVADTGNLLYYDRLKVLFPDAKFLVADRPREDVEVSLGSVGQYPPEYPLDDAYEALRRAKLADLLPSIQFDDIFTVSGLSFVWLTIFDEPPPLKYLEAMLKLRVEPRYLRESSRSAPLPFPG